MQRFLSLLVLVIALHVLQMVVAGDQLYWSDGGMIRRSELDGSAMENLVASFANGGIALDAAGDRMFWTDDEPRVPIGPTGVIRRASLDGSSAAYVLADIEAPIGIALDVARDKMYWTAGDNAIRRANLDGTNVEQIIQKDWIAELSGISLDLVNDQIYFSYVNPLIDNLFPGGVARANLDGSIVEPIIGGLGEPKGIAVDAAGQGIYWADARSNAGGGAIQAANLSGQQQHTLLAGLERPYGVSLDLTERNIYWTDTGTGKVQRTGMSGSLPFFQDVLTGLTNPTAIAFLAVPFPSFTWNVDADGNWSDAVNWTRGVPNSAADAAVFGGIITAPRTITVDASVTVGRIELNDINAYTISGSHTITLDATSGDAQIQVINGSHVIGAPIILADDTVISVTSPYGILSITGQFNAHGVTLTKTGAGLLRVNNLRAQALSINGGTVAIQANGGTSVLGTFSIVGDATPTASLDLSNNAAIVDYPAEGPNPETTIRAQIISARGGIGLGKSWNGLGITSSQAAADPVNSTSVGYAVNGSLPLGPYTAFGGQTVDASAALMRYTRTGDANLDGIVNNDDVTIVGANYAPGVPKPSWALGDFDYNGFVDNDDVTLLGVFYNPSALPIAAPVETSLNAPAAVPEPATLTLLGVISAAIGTVSLYRTCTSH